MALLVLWWVPVIVAGLIQGWNEGVAGMKVGERRKLTIPSNLAYGALGRLPVIPPNGTLILDIELLAIGEPPPDLKAHSLGAKFTIPTTAESSGGPGRRWPRMPPSVAPMSTLGKNRPPTPLPDPSILVTVSEVFTGRVAVSIARLDAST